MSANLNSLFRVFAGLILLISVLLQSPVHAQTIPGLPLPAPKADASQETAPTSRTSELIELLKDDTARNQLIAELEAQQKAAQQRACAS